MRWFIHRSKATYIDVSLRINIYNILLDNYLCLLEVIRKSGLKCSFCQSKSQLINISDSQSITPAAQACKFLTGRKVRAIITSSQVKLLNTQCKYLSIFDLWCSTSGYLKLCRPVSIRRQFGPSATSRSAPPPGS
jgi:hypothetical protein